MNTKLENIKKLIRMQKKFLDYYNEYGSSVREYFAPDDDNPLKGYKEKSDDVAREIIDAAHEEKDTKR